MERIGKVLRVSGTGTGVRSGGQRGGAAGDVLVTLAVPEEAGPDNAAALLAVATESFALQVMLTAGVEGHLPCRARWCCGDGSTN